MDDRRWDAIAEDVRHRPTDVRRKVQELIDAIIASCVIVLAEVAAIAGSAAGYVEQAAPLIENNALRIAECLR